MAARLEVTSHAAQPDNCYECTAFQDYFAREGRHIGTPRESAERQRLHKEFRARFCPAREGSPVLTASSEDNPLVDNIGVVGCSFALEMRRAKGVS